MVMKINKIKVALNIRNLVVLFLVVMLVVGVVVIEQCGFTLVDVSGNSMFPTLHDGEIVALHQNYDNISRGDIVSFLDLDTGSYFCKRVIALSGDSVEINADSGTVSVNGNILIEDYINSGAVYQENISLTVPENNLFLMGDNRNHSKDSRNFGCINECNVKGKIIKISTVEQKLTLIQS